MTLLRESWIYHFFAVVLLPLYERSALHRLFMRVGKWCDAQIDGSAVLRPLCREGLVARAWPTSLTCRGLTALVNLPGWILQRIYTVLQMTFEDSFFARLAFRMGDETAIAQSWLIMLLWIIPFSRWNNAYSFMGFFLLLALFYVSAMHRRERRLELADIGCYPVLMFLAVCLAVPCSYAPSLSARFLLYHLSAALCVLVTVGAVETVEDLKRLCAGGSVCVLVSGLYGILQRIQGVEVNPAYVDLKLNPDMPGRVMSFFDNPNTFAEVLILLLPLVLALVLCSRHWTGRILTAGIFLVGGAALLMTYSRASWVGLACAMVVMVFLWRPSLIPLFVLACMAAVPFLPASILNRILTITNFSDSSTSSRFPLYQAALAVIQKSPIHGGGLGTAATQAYIRDWRLYHGEAPFVHAHNFYLQVWIEAGLLGIVGFVGSLLWNIKRAAHTVRHMESSAARTITCAATSALCGAMVCGLADYLWNYPRVMVIFWFVFAMALAGVRVCRREVAANED